MDRILKITAIAVFFLGVGLIAYTGLSATNRPALELNASSPDLSKSILGFTLGTGCLLASALCSVIAGRLK